MTGRFLWKDQLAVPTAPNALPIPGTANTSHLEANAAAGTIALDDTTMSALDAVRSRSPDVPLG